MVGYIALALVAGGFVGMARSVNARLGMDRGALKASYWNHMIGFLLLTVFVVLFERSSFPLLGQAPPYAYIGGVIGAVFVALSSYVFPRIGASRSALLIIGGQMVAGLLIDQLRGTAALTLGQPVGVALILVGIYLTRFSR